MGKGVQMITEFKFLGELSL